MEQTYTPNDLEEATKSLREWQDKFERYTGNNPDKYQADIRTARRLVLLIENALKASGQLALSENEVLEKELDQMFPNAKSKEMVEYKGQKFQRKFWPLEKSRSGKNVVEWSRGWVAMGD
ncbi:hypothetical protein [Maritalea sp.]|uniref:hypothetical protein n=1 Tax=Maritalea sp. TaxID=2003361 RepID=UPI003EF3061E